MKGMNYFMPDTTVEKKQYKIVFTRLLIDGKSIAVGDTLNGKIVLEKDLSHISEVSLPYPYNNFSIEFSSLTYSQKKNIQYRYKLKGFDDDWVYINGLSPFAMYPKLPYKKYTFIVEVGSNNKWNDVVSKIDIDILPPWWLSAWAYLLYTIIVILIVYFTARYSLNWINLKRQITLQNEREKQKEELLELKMNFFTNISHEFKTPLTLINASVNEIENKFEQLLGNRYFQILKRNNSKLLHLISELMDFQRSNASLIELKTTEIDICKFVQEIVEEFMPLAERSSIDMKLTLPQNKILAWVDEECLVKIITNVISNSLRYTESGGEIVVKLSIGDLKQHQTQYSSKIDFTKDMQSGNQLLFSVSDTGVGISAESLPDVFERFHTVVSKTSKHLGSGVGLALVKSMVEFHKGGVLVSSERNKGTEFVFSIPLESDYLTENQKTTDSQFNRQLYFDDYKVQILDSEEITTTVNDETKPTLLIVDDNKDILMILNDHFKSEFNILMALDGQEALEICNEKYPDIIISDVMMPVMTGLEFCNKVKSQLNTCFIPVILLTARGTTEQQIEGIDEGADAYIPKPFHMGLLHATIINLLNKSKIASSRKVTNPEDDTTNKATRNLVIDQEKQLFIDKLTKLILNNIDNSDYSVEHLSLDIGISRSRLYGQIKSITNETLGDFIREVRLQKAAELFRTTSMSISEVGFQVGMESPSFFTRSFKQRFGMLPSEYIKRIKNNEI
jgi:signal transduction histidine kinase/DNA-binding response OmpR family regulator